MLFNKFLYLSTATCIAGMLLSPVFATASQNNQPPRHADKNQKLSAVGTFQQLASVKDGGENALNYFATGKIPNSDQVVQIRDTGPTQQEWIDIFKGMYALTQTTFNPYILLDGLDKNSQNYRHQMGVFLVYQLTKMYTVYGDGVFDKNYLVSGLHPYESFFNYVPQEDTDLESRWITYREKWLYKWMKKVDFKQLLNEAGVQVIDSNARKEWESTFIQQYFWSRPAQTQALVDLKRYMEGDNRVMSNVTNSMNYFIHVQHPQFTDRDYRGFALSPKFMDEINEAYQIAKDELNLRSPTYKGQLYFSDNFNDGPFKDHKRDEGYMCAFDKYGSLLKFRNGFTDIDSESILQYIANQTNVSDGNIQNIFKNAILNDSVNDIRQKITWANEYQEELKKLGINTRDLPYQDIVKKIKETQVRLRVDSSVYNLSEEEGQKLLTAVKRGNTTSLNQYAQQLTKIAFNDLKDKYGSTLDNIVKLIPVLDDYAKNLQAIGIDDAKSFSKQSVSAIVFLEKVKNIISGIKAKHINKSDVMQIVEDLITGVAIDSDPIIQAFKANDVNDKKHATNIEKAEEFWNAAKEYADASRG